MPARASASPPSSPSPRARPSEPAPKSVREGRERDERLKAALEWRRFESWCTANGLPSLPANSEPVAVVALYITHMAATGRTVATVARALLKHRETLE